MVASVHFKQKLFMLVEKVVSSAADLAINNVGPFY